MNATTLIVRPGMSLFGQTNKREAFPGGAKCPLSRISEEQ